MKNIILVFCLVIFVAILFSVICWKNMSTAEKWLFLNIKSATEYSNILIEHKTDHKLANDLIDINISTKNNIVLFSSNDQNNFFILAYSPNGIPELIETKHKKTYWKKLKDRWYELIISQAN